MLTGDDVAIKMEPLHVEHETNHPSTLAYESAIYKLLGKPSVGFPSLLWSGKDHGNYILILEKLGPNLASLFKFCRRKFSRRTVCAWCGALGGNCRCSGGNQVRRRAWLNCVGRAWPSVLRATFQGSRISTHSGL